MEEIWRNVGINNYYDKYEISTYGRVRSIYCRERDIKQTGNENGYLYVCFFLNDKPKTFSVHRLVAITFLPNFYGKKEVNHKDRNRSNNNLLNLEWVTRKENVQHANKIPRKTKIVLQYDLQMNFIEKFNSTKDAAKFLKLNHSTGIINTCLGKQKKAHGFIWRYENHEFEKNDVNLNEFKQLKDYPIYYVSSDGRVYNSKSNKFLTQQDCQGYRTVNINKKNKRVHILVAGAFLVKPDDIEVVVDHINSIRNDNRVENLRYVTQSENVLASLYSENGKRRSAMKACAKYDLNLNLIETYMSIKLAARENNIQPSAITRCCKGNARRVSNFIFKFVES